MSKSLDDLRPDVAAKAEAALTAARAHGIPCVITSTLRTLAEQQALYAQGRQALATVNTLRAAAALPLIGERENGYTVTNCDGKRKADGGTGRSPHQLGTALDVVPLGEHGPEWPGADDERWNDIAYFFEAEGFEWGGRLADFPDRPHYQVGA